MIEIYINEYARALLFSIMNNTLHADFSQGTLAQALRRGTYPEPEKLEAAIDKLQLSDKVITRLQVERLIERTRYEYKWSQRHERCHAVMAMYLAGNTNPANGICFHFDRAGPSSEYSMGLQTLFSTWSKCQSLIFPLGFDEFYAGKDLWLNEDRLELLEFCINETGDIKAPARRAVSFNERKS